MSEIDVIDKFPSGKIPEIPNRLFAFIWYFVRQMKMQMFVIFLFFGLSSVLYSLKPYFIMLIVEVFESTVNKEDIWMNIFNIAVAYVVLLLILQPIFDNIASWKQASTMSIFANMARRQLAIYMNHHSYGFFQNDLAGRIANRIISTPMYMRQFMETLVGPVWFTVVVFIVSFVLFSVVHWVFALVLFVWFCLFILIVWYFVPTIRSLSLVAEDKISEANGRYVDIVSNISLVKLFSRLGFEDRQYTKLLKDNVSAYTVRNRRIVVMNIWIEIISVMFLLAIPVICIYGWQNDILSLAQIAMVLPLMVKIVDFAFWISDIFTSLFRNFGEIEEGMNAIVKVHGLKDVSNAKSLIIKSPEIKFNNVNFNHDNNVLFKRFNLKIKAGDKVGLIGHSGAGKSSLTQILLRLYDIADGKIEIDGQDISKVTQDSLRINIALIPQTIDMFHRTVRENIAYGNIDATDDQIIAAAKKAYAHEFIGDLVDNKGNKAYDAIVGERGVKLSGGQCQRIAIARAILKDAPILILDEATSALDSESEKYIQDSLKDLMDGKTVIAIAHRLSTIAHLDRLLVMENGKIVEDGTHDELLKIGGVYAKLWSMQSGGFLQEEDKA